MVSYLLIAFVIFLFLEFWIFLGYPFFLFIISLFIHRKYERNDNYRPAISLIILTYNEEVSIRKKIINSLELEYEKNKLEIIVVDSNSTDSTQSIVREFEHRGVRLLVQLERRGKASAIDFGIGCARHEIIITTDANAFFSKDVLNKVVPYFFDKHVGGVTGAMRQQDHSQTSISMSGEFYWKFEKKIRILESKIHSCIGMSGEICCFRKKIFENVTFQDWYKKSEADDFSLSLFIISKGYRIAYADDARVWEMAPAQRKDLFNQKVRIIVQTINTMIHRFYRPTLGPSLYSFLILPSRKYLSLFSPLFLLLILLINILLVILVSNTIMIISLIIQINFYLLSLTGFLYISRRIPILTIINFFVLLNLTVLNGWYEFFKKKDYTIWDKVVGTRGNSI